MGVVAIRVMGGGVLAGDAAAEGFAGTTSSESVLGRSRDEELNQAKALAFLESESDPGGGVRQAAIRFALANDEICSSLMGFSTVSHIEAAAEATGQGPLDSRLDESAGAIVGLWISAGLSPTAPKIMPRCRDAAMCVTGWL